MRLSVGVGACTVADYANTPIAIGSVPVLFGGDDSTVVEPESARGKRDKIQPLPIRRNGIFWFGARRVHDFNSATSLDQCDDPVLRNRTELRSRIAPKQHLHEHPGCGPANASADESRL